MTQERRATSFDFFGTLVDVDTPADPAGVVAAALADRGVDVPENWGEAYRRPRIEAPPGAEVPLPDHVRAVLDGETDERSPPDPELVEEAVLAAFEAEVSTRESAAEAVGAAAEVGPVGILSNCSVPGLVERSLAASTLDSAAFDAVVTSVECGWRKPDRRAFEAVATRLETPLPSLVHVGDDPDTDGGASDAGASAVIVGDRPLESVPEAITENAGNGG